MFQGLAWRDVGLDFNHDTWANIIKALNTKIITGIVVVSKSELQYFEFRAKALEFRLQVSRI